MIELPIDVVPGRGPPRFRWRQMVSSPVGTKWVNHEGPLPPSVEEAVAALVRLAKQQAAEIEELRKPAALPVPTPAPAPTQMVPVRKARG